MRSFFRNPIIVAIGWLGGVAGIFSIPLSIHLATSSPELTYYYNGDSYFNVINKTSLSKLHVFHDDLNGEIKDNLSIIKIKVWNAGNKVIRDKDIRDPITISSESGVKILEAFLLDSDNKSIDILNNKQNIQLTVNILEPNEGNTIQILYTGINYAKFKLDGRVIGQPSIDKWSEIPGAKWFIKLLLVSGFFVILSMSINPLVFILNKTIYRKKDTNEKINKIKKFNETYGWVPMIVFTILMLYALFWVKIGVKWMIPF